MRSDDLKIGMRGVTLVRPWPWTLSNGRIRVLGARRRPPKHLIGQVVAIHAGPEWDQDTNTALREVCASPELAGHHPYGIVALAKIRGYATWPGDPRIARAGQQAWFRPPVAWLFDEVVGIEPVGCSGARDPAFKGLWRVPDTVVELLRHRIKRDIVDWRGR